METPERACLKKELNLWDGTAVVMGIVIGSGVFLVARDIAQALPSPGWGLLVWLVGGIFTLLGALTFAELGAGLPGAGGQYVYLREAFGPLWGFLFGWTFFFIIHTGSIAAVSVAFALYLGDFLKLSPWGIKGFALACMLFLSLVNYFGVREGCRVQGFFTALKIAALLLLIGAAFALKGGTPQHFTPLFLAPEKGMLAAFGIGLVAVLWSFDGWNCVTFVAEEMKNPQRDLPRSLLLGTAGVTALYLLVNLAYYYLLPLSAISGSERVAADAAIKVTGTWGGKAISLMVVLSCLGCVNGMVLSGPRLFYAMARDGLFFSQLSGIHPRYQTPAVAIWVQAGWAGLLILSGTYDQLFTYVIFAAWIFYGMAAAAVPILRIRHPEWQRPYKVPGYPFTPWLFVLLSGWFVINTLIQKPVESLIGLGLVLIGIPAYLYWSKGGIREEGVETTD